MAWEYKREEAQFKVLPEGIYRIRIKSADKAVSSNGNDMLVLQFEVSGETKILYHYIVFMNDRPEITNRMLTQFFDSFKDIPEGDFNMANWVGKVGAAKIKHDEYQGQTREKISYFVNANKQGDLPSWKEPNGATVDADGFMQPSGDLEDLPF